jgi:hypothetical protein
MMLKKQFLIGVAESVLLASPGAAFVPEVLKVGLIQLIAAASAATLLTTTAFCQRMSQSTASVPDFFGIWVHGSIPGFEPLASGPTSLINRSRIDFVGAGFPSQHGVSDPNHLVGDYTNPILKPATAEVVKRYGENELSGVGSPTPRTQCWPGGIPFVFTSGAIQILQQADKIAILYNYDHQVRHVRLNQSHPAYVMPTWYGDSVARYDGDTLVIDTEGIKVGPFAMVDWYGTPHTEALHVIERYRLIDYDAAKEGWERDAKENFRVQPTPNYLGKYLQLEFTVEDVGVFTTPWTATMTYGRGPADWAEDVCAENIQWYSGKNAAVPRADKPDF